MMTNTKATYAPGTKVHKFELAGLGTAPYAYLGIRENMFKAGDVIKPGGSCDYCGAGIRYEYWLRGADGRTFKVGSDCVLKTCSDRALIVAVKTEEQKRQAEKREAKRRATFERQQVEIDAAVARLPEVADRLRAEPHPNAGPYFADKTRLDWIEWMLAHAGQAGRLTVARYIITTIEAAAR